MLGQNEPARQSLHWKLAILRYSALHEQFLISIDPLKEFEYCGHVAQTDTFVMLLYRPAAQFVHTVALTTLNVPILQGISIELLGQ